MTAIVDTLRLSAEDAIGLVERKEVSPAELHGAYLDAIAERDGELHALLRTVDEADGTSIPIALKDVISTKGVETTAGSKILSGYVPVFDATVAARCRAVMLEEAARTGVAGHIHLGVNVLVPKPYTPWQRQPMDSERSLKRKISILKAGVARLPNVSLGSISVRQVNLAPILEDPELATDLTADVELDLRADAFADLGSLEGRLLAHAASISVAARKTRMGRTLPSTRPWSRRVRPTHAVARQPSVLSSSYWLCR